MIKLKFFSLVIGLWLIANEITAQNWQALDNGLNKAVRSLYADTTNLLLYTGKDLMSSGINAFDYWNGVHWDTLRSINSPIYSINKFQGNVVISNGKIYTYDSGVWIPFASVAASLYNYDDNNLFATGWFDTIGGVAASKVAKWDGTNWSAIDTTKWLGGEVSCSIIYNGELYIGGNMWNHSNTIEGIARWDGNEWQPVANGIRGGMAAVGCFEIYNNKLYVGGRFNLNEGNPGNSIACWDGLNWYDVGGGMTSLNASVWDLQTFNNELYACGGFLIAGGQQIIGIAKWNESDWCGLDFNNSNYQIPNTMAVMNNELYMGGSFKDINGDTMNYVAKWIGGNFTDVCGNTTGLKNADSKGVLSISPNPAYDFISITYSISENSQTHLQLINSLGQVVKEIASNQQKGSHTLTLDANLFAKGIYYVSFFDGLTSIRTKVIIQ